MEDRKRLLDDSGSEIEYEYETSLLSKSGGSVQERIAKKGSATFEDAVSATGYGRFHIQLLLVCGWAVSSDAVEILGISFILPPATCDLNLDGPTKGWINSSVFIGMMIGGLFWGTLADIQGRRAVLLWSLSINAIGGLASSFAQHTWLFILCRLVSGIGVGGSMPVIFSYFTEFQPKEKRGSAISMLATFWMAGNVLAAALAWAIIPIDFHLSSPGFSYRSWRLYLALCVLPSFTSVLTYVLMPESPKYLLQKGNELEALQVFRRMYRTNFRTKDISAFPVTSLVLEDSGQELEDYEIVNSVWVEKVKRSTAKFLRSVKNVYMPPLTSRSIVMTVIYFTLSFGFYGLFMWLPELFKRIELYGGNPCRDVTNGNTTSSGIETCVVPNKVFFDNFITAASNLPGNILTIFIIDRVGRKILLSGSMVLSALCVFFLYLVESSAAGLAMSCIFSGVSVIAWNAIDVLQAEIYPTHVRSTASGVLMSVGRVASILGNVVFGQLIDLNCAVPMVTVATLLLLGGLSAVKLPNMLNQDLL